MKQKVENWAERECRIACQKENPDYNFDGCDFDYGCSCYKSALKAYNSMSEDGHSGFSWNETLKILERLMRHLPLTPITDEDFFQDKDTIMLYPEEELKNRGEKSVIQCPRMSSLFRTETLDGKVTYLDVDRSYYINAEDESDTYSSNHDFLDEMFPITMPYIPKKNKFKIYAQTFLVDKKNGDFDTRGILYLITPEGERVDLNIFMTWKDGKWIKISKEEYEELKKRRIDKVSEKAAEQILWTLICNSGTDKEIERKELSFKLSTDKCKEEIRTKLLELCTCFDNEEFWKYNTFDTRQNLCYNKIDKYKDVPELIEIAKYLQEVLKIIMQK